MQNELFSSRTLLMIIGQTFGKSTAFAFFSKLIFILDSYVENAFACNLRHTNDAVSYT